MAASLHRANFDDAEEITEQTMQEKIIAGLKSAIVEIQIFIKQSFSENLVRSESNNNKAYERIFVRGR